MPAKRSVSCSILLTALTWLYGFSAGAANVTVPLRDGSGATSRMLSVDLETGRIFELEPRRGGEAIRIEPSAQNLFNAIGRPLDQPAAVGEILVEEISDRAGRTRAYLMLETSSGYLAYFTRPGEKGLLGELRTITGRVAEPLASADGQYVWLRRWDPARRWEVGYLIHASEGGCLVFAGIDRLEQELVAGRCEGVPTFRLGSNAVPIESDGGLVSGYAVIDATDGALLLLSFASDGDRKLLATRSPLALNTLFPQPEGAAPARRYALASVRTSGGGTVAVLAADTATGRLALLSGLERPSTARGALLAEGMTAFSRREQRSRPLEALPLVSPTRQTQGVWLVGEERSDLVWVSNLTSSSPVTVQRVEERN